MPKVYIAITADWEGEDFKNLRDFKKIRREMSDHIPFTHFICPNYFLNQTDKPTENILETITRTDRVGLHIHCYRELIASSGVEFRRDPNYHRPLSPFQKWLRSNYNIHLKKVTGRGVPLSAYSEREIRQIIRMSCKLLQSKLDLPDLTTFRAGGWMANDVVLQILSEEGFSVDSSAIPPGILSQGFQENHPGDGKDDYQESNGIFTDFIRSLWGPEIQDEPFLQNKIIVESRKGKLIQRTTQPWHIDKILELPNNGGLTDFASPQKTLRPLLEYGLNWMDRHQRDFFICTGIHQEGPIEYKIPLLKFIRSLTHSELQHIEFIDIPTAGKIFG